MIVEKSAFLNLTAYLVEKNKLRLNLYGKTSGINL